MISGPLRGSYGHITFLLCRVCCDFGYFFLDSRLIFLSVRHREEISCHICSFDRFQRLLERFVGIGFWSNSCILIWGLRGIACGLSHFVFVGDLVLLFHSLLVLVSFVGWRFDMDWGLLWPLLCLVTLCFYFVCWVASLEFVRLSRFGVPLMLHYRLWCRLFLLRWWSLCCETLDDFVVVVGILAGGMP